MLYFNLSTTTSRSWLWINQWSLINKYTRYVCRRADLCTQDRRPQSSAGVAWERVSFGGDKRVSIFENLQPVVLSVFRWSATGGFAEGYRTSVDKSGVQVQVRKRGAGWDRRPFLVCRQNSKRLLQCKYKIAMHINIYYCVPNSYLVRVGGFSFVVPLMSV